MRAASPAGPFHGLRRTHAPVTSTPLARVLARAASQYGLITSAQCREAGSSRKAVQRLIARGVWTRDAPGVYRVVGVPRTWEGSALCAALAAGPDALVSHRSAAHLWGLQGFAAPGRIEITVARHDRPAPRSGVVVHESVALDLADGRRRWGVPVTGPAHTFLDVAAGADDLLVVLRALDETRRLAMPVGPTCGRRCCTPGRAAVASRWRARCCACAQASGCRIRSSLASSCGWSTPRACRSRCRSSTWPSPEIATASTAPTRALVAVELDGKGHVEPEAVDSDHARDNRLEAASGIVLRLTWRRFSTRPDEVVAEVQAALSSRGVL